jgi:amino acid transporter
MASEPQPVQMKKTLGLTGLTMNAMALIAPGAFLWLTFAMQCQYGAPMAGLAIWFGIVVALLLCFATAISYAELSKLYPGAGSSYFFAEQAFLSKTRAYKFARIAKFVTGWASHLYYWVYPGVMVGVTAILFGWLAGQLFPTVFSPAVNSPTLMIAFCVLFSLGVAYIAYRGVAGTTGVNIAVNIVQIAALLVFSVIAVGYRLNHNTEGCRGYTLDPDSNPIQVVLKNGDDGKPLKDPKTDAYVVEQEGGADKPYTLEYAGKDVTLEDADKDHPELGKTDTAQFHKSALSVVLPHGFSYVIVQACIAILILVGFESVTSLGEEAKNAKRDIPRAVLLSLLIQGVVCYLIEYFSASYFLNPGYTMTAAAGSSAPIGDQMVIAASWLFQDTTIGWWFMFIEALTVLLALVGTTLSCMSTGARVTYAMGRDDEVPSHFGLLHGKNLTPHRAIWVLAGVSAAVGIFAVLLYLCGPAASDAMNTALSDAQKQSFWYPGFLTFSMETAKGLPNSLLMVTLVSNFGTFMLYMLTCGIAIVAFREHHSFSGIKHLAIPVFGMLANLVCMLFYLIGPFAVNNMSKLEPFLALAVAAVWGVYGWWYFVAASRAKGRSVLVQQPRPGDWKPAGA